MVITFKHLLHILVSNMSTWLIFKNSGPLDLFPALKAGIACFLSFCLAESFRPAPAHDDPRPEINMNLGRQIGWIQASCSFAKTGWISKSNASQTIRVLLKVIEDEHGKWMSQLVARQQLLEMYPWCDVFWLKELKVPEIQVPDTPNFDK